MKNYLFVYLFLLFPLLLAGQFSQLLDESEFIKKTAEITADLNTMTSDFIQEKHLNFMSEPIITKGRFFYKKSNKIRWEYTSPFSYILIINEDQLLIDDEGHQNKIDLANNDMFKEINTIVAKAMMGEVIDDTSHFTHNLEESNTEYKINLIPSDKSLKEFLLKIIVFFEKETLIVSRVILEETSEDFTKIIFSKKQMNAVISDDKFQLDK